MGWGFRRSINLGPLRVNLSKSGIGYSVGTRGFRVGKDARGRKYRSISIPHTGISRRDYYQAGKTQTPGTPLAPNPNAVPMRPVRPGLAKIRSTGWPLYVGGGVLLYAIIRVFF